MKDNYNTNWQGVRMVDKLAGPINSRQVRNVRAVQVTSGSIRSAKVSGVFELVAESGDAFSTHAGRRKVEVRCLWYGRKPPTTWMHLTVIGTCEVFDNYTGPVVSDIGR